MRLSSFIPILFARRNNTHQANGTIIGYDFRHLADSSRVLLAVFFRPAEVGIKTEPGIVAVENAGVDFPLDQVLFDGAGNGGFPRAGETGQSDGAAFGGSSC